MEHLAYKKYILNGFLILRILILEHYLEYLSSAYDKTVTEISSSI